MILEDALHSKNAKLILPPRDLKRMNASRYKVKRFIFDENASARAGSFATECADLVCEHSQFALPPFPNTYIELDQIAALRASTWMPIAEDTASRIGFLFMETGDVFICYGDGAKWAEFSPYRYHRKDEDTAAAGPEHDRYLKYFMLGEVADTLRPDVDRFAHRLTDIWDVSPTVTLSPQIAQVMENECRGQLKRALAAVLLLNQKRNISFRDVPTTRGLSRGKMRAYMAHSVVSIDLAKTTIRRAFQIDHRATPRRHEVRGHFVHYNIEDYCSHEWEPLKDAEQQQRDIERVGRSIPRWRCANCGGIRVRREAHHRGDATKGFVTKEYKVTDSGE